MLRLCSREPCSLSGIDGYNIIEGSDEPKKCVSVVGVQLAVCIQIYTYEESAWVLTAAAGGDRKRETGESARAIGKDGEPFGSECV